MGLSSDPERRARQLANLRPRPWGPGEVPNPLGINGRPIRAALLRQATGDQCDRLAAVVWRHALRGKPWAVQFLAERLEGKAPQEVDVSGEVEHTVTIENIRKALGIEL
jgi:hypothetical protein